MDIVIFPVSPGLLAFVREVQVLLLRWDGYDLEPGCVSGIIKFRRDGWILSHPCCKVFCIAVTHLYSFILLLFLILPISTFFPGWISLTVVISFSAHKCSALRCLF